MYTELPLNFAILLLWHSVALINDYLLRKSQISNIYISIIISYL